MSRLEHRLKRLQRLTGKRERPSATIEHTSDGQYYLLDGDARTRIGTEDDFKRWQAEGNTCGVILQGLTPEGAALVMRLVASERTRRSDRQ